MDSIFDIRHSNLNVGFNIEFDIRFECWIQFDIRYSHSNLNVEFEFDIQHSNRFELIFDKSTFDSNVGFEFDSIFDIQILNVEYRISNKLNSN